MLRRTLRALVLIGVAAIPACSGKQVSGTDQEMKAGLDALYKLHDPSAAVPHFQKVLTLDANHYGATFQLAKALDASGHPEQAEPLWIRMFTMADAAHDASTLAIVRERLGKGASNPQDATMRRGMDALYVRRDPVAAIGFFREVLKMNPAHYGATYQLANALDLAGKSPEARPYWEKALQMAESYRDKPTIELIRPHLSGTR